MSGTSPPRPQPPPSPPTPRPGQCGSPPDEMSYAGLGEAEAGMGSQDPMDPHTFPVAFKDQGSATTAEGAAPSLASTRRSRNAARRLQREVEARLQTESLITAIQQNALKENPVLTEEVHKQVHVGHEMLAGSASAFVSRMCVAPLDVLKIRFQIQEQAASQRQYTSVAQAFKTIYQKEGLLAFWKGNAAAELMVMPYGAVSFLAYSTCKSWFPVPDHASYQHLSSLIAGSFAGFCATLSTYPLDLLRTRFAAQQEQKVYRSLLHAGKHIVSREGLSGLYVGIVPTLIGIVPLMALQFGTYEAFKQAIKNAKCPVGADPATMQLSFMEQSLSGFSAGVMSKFLTMPLDVIKKRFQAAVNAPIPATVIPKLAAEARGLLRRRWRRHDQPVAGRRPFTGVWDCARGIHAHEGFHGLFKGSVPSMLKAGPNSAIIYMVYEYTIRWLNRDIDCNANANNNHKHKA